MERAALYIRVSSEEQAIHGLSIEAQREKLDQWARGRVKCRFVKHMLHPDQ